MMGRNGISMHGGTGNENFDKREVRAAPNAGSGAA